MKIRFFVSFGFIVLLLIASYVRNIAWENEVILWEDATKKSPLKKRAHDNLGFAYYMEGRFEEAIKEYLPVLRKSNNTSTIPK